MSSKSQVAGSVVAGFPSPAEQYLEPPLDLNELLVKRPAATFFVKVEGDSMINAGIHDKDLLVVDRSLTPANGGVALSPLVQRTMAVGRLTLLEVDLSAMFAFEKFQHHVRRRLAARPMWAKETRGVLEQTRVAAPVDIVLVEIEKPD